MRTELTRDVNSREFPRRCRREEQEERNACIGGWVCFPRKSERCPIGLCCSGLTLNLESFSLDGHRQRRYRFVRYEETRGCLYLVVES